MRESDVTSNSGITRRTSGVHYALLVAYMAQVHSFSLCIFTLVQHLNRLTSNAELQGMSAVYSHTPVQPQTRTAYTCIVTGLLPPPLHVRLLTAQGGGLLADAVLGAGAHEGRDWVSRLYQYSS
jgi:hypothetical protein